MNKGQLDRRRWRRISLRGGTAICHHEYGSRVYEVGDVSQTGVRLSRCKDLRMGEIVDLEVWWPGVGDGLACGTVVRVDETGDAGVDLLGWDGRFASLVDDLGQLETERRFAPVTLVYSHDERFQNRVVGTLEKQGGLTVSARVPLEAICHLEDPWLGITCVVTDTSRGGLEFADFLARDEPRVRCVVVQPRAEGVNTVFVEGMRNVVPSVEHLPYVVPKAPLAQPAA